MGTAGARTLEAEILQRVLLLQSALHAAPDARRLAEMVASGLSVLPGVAGCRVCLDGSLYGGSGAITTCPAVTPGVGASFEACAAGCPLARTEGVRRVELRTAARVWGGLLLRVQDEEALGPSLALAQNTANLVALRLEHDDAEARLAQLNQSLEARAAEATARTRRDEEILAVRLDLLEGAPAETLSDFLRRTLERICEQTESPIGFFHFVEPGGETISLQQWSTRTLREYCHTEGEGMCYPLGEAGVWADAIRRARPVLHNDYAALPDKRGLPPGHAELVRELVVPVLRGGEVVAVLGVGNKASDYTDEDVETVTLLADVTWEGAQRKRSDAERDRLLAGIENSGDTVLITDVSGKIEYVNPAFCEITGYGAAEAIGQNPRVLKSGEQDEVFYRALWETILGGRTWRGRFVNRRKDGSRYTEDATISPVRDEAGRITHFVAVKRDVTESLKLEAQLHQAAKLEAVGRLAGGVAHDFNNMLSVILGNAELAAGALTPDHPVRLDLQEIRHAAERSRDITRQLLAFARKQDLRPEVLSLDAAVERSLKMLRRLIGENIELLWKPGARGGCVRVDRGQLDQILANLCVNARDAIADVGALVLETAPVILDGDAFPELGDQVPGPFLRLIVSDTGAGMDADLLEHIFEPFYTTKGIGKGTGLGLATVHGTVRQSGGTIHVYSELGLGTTFKIYLPRVDEAGDRADSTPAEPVPRGAGQTILVVEDNPGVLQLAERMVRRLGYRPLVAPTPYEALRLAEAHGDEIDLLLTDVVMPEMNGRALADTLRERRPGLRCLFMSGYAADAVKLNGLLAPGSRLLPKPFTLEDLARALRAALDEAPDAAPDASRT